MPNRQMVALWTEGPKVLFRPCSEVTASEFCEVTATLVRPTWMIFDHKKHLGSCDETTMKLGQS
jgi:hypothetical protein